MVCKHVALFLQKNILTAIIICCFFYQPAMAQQKKPTQKENKIIIIPPVKPFYFKDHDSSYYDSFERYITARFIFQKNLRGLSWKGPALRMIQNFSIYPILR